MPRRHAPAAVLAVLAVCALAGCGSAGAGQPLAAPSGSAAAAAPSPACTLKTSYDYIVRDSRPGSVTAEKIGNVNLASCKSALSGFAALAGQAPGECTTIAKAADNPGYNVNAVNPAPLKKVIKSVGPGCGS